MNSARELWSPGLCRSLPDLLPNSSPELPPRPPPRSPLATENSPSGKLPRPAMPCWLPAANSRQMLPQFAKQAKSDVELVWHFMESHPFFLGMSGLCPRINFTDLPLGHESYRNFMGLVELNGGTKITFPFTATSSLPYIFPKNSPYLTPEQRGLII